MTPRDELEQVIVELRDYPRPVAGCDAQFNHLLDRRAVLETQIRETTKGEEARCS